MTHACSCFFARQRLPRLLLLLAVSGLISGCNLPRGAALQSEVLKDQRAEDRDYQVISVTKDNLDSVSAWPATGGFAP